MGHAFARCVNVADQIGAHFIVLDALNERSAKLYRELGFVDLPGHEPRMIITMGVVRKAIPKASLATIKLRHDPLEPASATVAGGLRQPLGQHVQRVSTVAFEGIEARAVDLQVQVAPGLPAFNIVGLPDKAVSEAKDRVRAALVASGLR
jgi:hypothetical protein